LALPGVCSIEPAERLRLGEGSSHQKYEFFGGRIIAHRIERNEHAPGSKRYVTENPELGFETTIS